MHLRSSRLAYLALFPLFKSPWRDYLCTDTTKGCIRTHSQCDVFFAKDCSGWRRGSSVSRSVVGKEKSVTTTYFAVFFVRLMPLAFSISASFSAFFLSNSACLQFSSCAFRNNLMKFKRVTVTARLKKKNLNKRQSASKLPHHMSKP